MAERPFQVQGYQGDAGGLLVRRNPNELLICLTLNGSPTNVSPTSFMITPMASGLLPGVVVGVNQYAGGALGLSLAQQRNTVGGQVLPGAPWPTGPSLFRIAVYWSTSLWGTLEASCLATANIESPPTVERDWGDRLGDLQMALQQSEMEGLSAGSPTTT